MHTSRLLPLLAAGPVLAQLPMFGLLAGTLDNSTQGKCNQLAMFQNMVDLVTDPHFSNAMSAVIGGSQVQQTMSHALEAVLTTVLDPLKKDQALVDGCKATIAIDNMVFSCFTVQQFDGFNSTMSNQTMLDMMTNGDQTKQANLKTLLGVMSDRANTIRSNATVVDFCKNNVDMRCVNQKLMTKLVSLASNSAAVNMRFNGNATMIQMFQDHVSMTQKVLDTLKADTALQAICAKMPNALPINIDAMTLDSFPTGQIPGDNGAGAGASNPGTAGGVSSGLGRLLKF